jgi:hypothetical protein
MIECHDEIKRKQRTAPLAGSLENETIFQPVN